MIPPVPPSVLTANPQFALLHQHLTTHLLTPDASTRSLSFQHEPTTKQLRQHHVQAAKEDILKRGLHNIVADENLPPELVELVLTIASYLSEAPNMNLSREAHDLIATEAAAFREYLHLASTLLSQHISRERDSLLRLAQASRRPSTSTGPGITNTTTSSLSTKPTTTTPSLPLTTALAHLSTHQHTALPTAIRTHTTTLSHLLALHTTYSHNLIRTLELHTHGTLSRHHTSHATYTSTVATALATKIHLLALQAHQAVYSPEGPVPRGSVGLVQRALANYAAHLQGCRERLERRGEVIRRELAVYEEGGGEGLRECARRYGGVVREVEGVKGEMGRLRG